jgi:hypothetical protein
MLLFLMSIPFISLAQQPEPPGPPACPSNNNNKVGGTGPAGAPLEDGVWLTLGMAICYGTCRFLISARKPNVPSARQNVQLE